MEFIKMFMFDNVEYRVFYDKDLKVLNYFCKYNNRTQCFSLKIDKFKELVDVNTEEDYKRKSEQIFKLIISQTIIDNIGYVGERVISNTFDNDFWEKYVLTNFNNYKFELIKAPNRQKLVDTYIYAIDIMNQEINNSDNPYARVPIMFLENEKDKIIKGNIYDRHGNKYYFESEYVS